MARIPYFAFLLIVFWYCLKYSHSAVDTISHGHDVTYSQAIISADSKFKLGFFQPGSSKLYYLGIWYNEVSVKTFVWVANRDYPLTSSSPVLSINNDGNLAILDGNVSHMVNNKSVNKTATATLLDTGNLVLRDEKLNTLWQSFDYPSHVFIPGMKIGYNRLTGMTWKLVSWRSLEDPGLGNYSMELSRNGKWEIHIMKGVEMIWSSGPWNGKFFALTPEMRLSYISTHTFINNDEMSYFTYDMTEKYNNTISMYEMDVSGQLLQMSWSENTKVWNPFWSTPRDPCKLDYCGAFGICNFYASNQCSCLQGFEPRFGNQWSNKDYTGGCVRKTKLSCTVNNHGGGDKFLALPQAGALPGNPLPIQVKGSEKCKSICLKNCSCTGYTYLDDFCTIWVVKLFNMQLQTVSFYGTDFFLKLAGSELPGYDVNIYKKLKFIIPLTISVIVLTIALFILLEYRKRNKIRGEDMLKFDSNADVRESKDELREVKMPRKARKDAEIPFFSFSSISMATNNFSADNKLGEGGFGPVYKGQVLNGSEVAVKRLSKKSGQGWDELRNEALLIAKLQHKNLVKLLGYCIDGDEKILIYEYMPNKSLDFFIFDTAKRGLLDWGTRISIIEGIAQGILYLHQFSRVQIIHRDLKASNILLDEDMNPKISDFGMARIFAGTGPQATTRIVGTYGYMAPEYALQGIFSVKSDVFSFGVLLLEILSSKRNTGFYTSSCLNLLGRAWDLWIMNKSLDLVDPILEDISSANTASRCITIALLCVQETAADRPTMSDVVSMLSNEHSDLPSPNQPAFSNLRSMVHPDSGNNMGDVCSVNDVTVSTTTPR